MTSIENVKGTNVHFTLGSVSAALPDFVHVTNVATIAFLDRDSIVAVELRRGIDLPGGHKEPEDTDIIGVAKREMMEEACVAINGPFYVVGVIESDYYAEPSYMIVLATRVTELQEFVQQHESFNRELVTPDEFVMRYKAGSIEMMSELMHRAKLVGNQLFELPLST